MAATPEAGTSIIERCAQIADHAAAELEGVLKSGAARRSHYDRQTKPKLEYAMEWCRRIAERIREMDSGPAAQPSSEITEDNAVKAFEVLRELVPLIRAARSSNWQAQMLRRIEEILLAQHPIGDE